MVACSSLLGTGLALALLAPHARPAWAAAAAHPRALALASAAAVCGYASTSLVLLLIKHYGAANAEIVKTLRKVLSVAASFVLFRKRFAPQHAMGLAATALSLALTVRLRAARRKLLVAPATSGATLAGPAEENGHKAAAPVE